MPGKSDIMAAQSEIGVLGLREPRRSESALSRGNASAVGRTSFRARGAGNGLRSARSFNSENTNPNVMTGTGTNGRRSPRLGGCSGSGNSRPLYAYASARNSGALADITNVAANRTATAAGNSDKVKPLRRQQLPLQQLVPPPTTEVPAVQEPAPEEQLAPVSVDGADKADVQNAAEYAPDFYESLLQEEATFLPRPDYIDGQTDLTAKMRTILIDWLIEVHMKYRLRPETLHLTVNLIDRYLSKATVTRRRLQLVGVVAMSIASKFEEIHPPELHDWVYITDNAYTKDEILVMECSMLTALSFQVMVPTAAHFAPGLQKANGCDDLHREVANYLLELALLDIRMLQHKPSLVVAATLLLSNELLGRCGAWPSTMVEHSRQSESDLRGCADELRQLLQADQSATGQLQAVRKKFSTSQRHSVAKMAF